MFQLSGLCCKCVHACRHDMCLLKASAILNNEVVEVGVQRIFWGLRLSPRQAVVLEVVGEIAAGGLATARIGDRRLYPRQAVVLEVIGGSAAGADSPC